MNLARSAFFISRFSSIPMSRKFSWPLVVAIFVLPASAATFFVSETSIVSTTIPDNDDVGVADTLTIVLPEGGTVSDLSVNLVLSGGWNGDLYAYLVSDTGFTVLLNRPGRTSSATDGAGSSGMNVTFTAGAATDVHTGLPTSGSDVTGIFQPDGRETDPADTLDTDARTALFDSFYGINAAGDWTLFIVDQAAGDEATFESWTLNLTVVPEPGTCLLVCFGAVLALHRHRTRC